MEDAVVTEAAVETRLANEGEGLVVESGQLGESLFELDSTLIGRVFNDAVVSSSSSFPGSIVVSEKQVRIIL